MPASRDRSIQTPPESPGVGRGAQASPEDDLVPVSVRLGQVVPPEDPEDWTRPLTWVAALGMLAPPLVALGVFLLARPESGEADARTLLIATALVFGACLTGSTQLERGWAFAATLGAGLFASLGVVLAAAAVSADPAEGALGHAVAAILIGLAGVLAAAALAALAAPVTRRIARFSLCAAVGLGATGLVAALVL